MWMRLYFALIALFWIVMNALLWRAEFGGGRDLGATVPEEMVWQRILTAPDDSTLEISGNGKKIGYCRWVANVGEPVATGRQTSEEPLPEGMVRELTGYTVDLDGNLVVGDAPSRIRFTLHLGFATNNVWKDVLLRVTSRPETWEIQSRAADEKLRLKYESDEGRWSRVFAFDELRDPRKLVEEFVGPLAVPLMAQWAPAASEQKLTLGLKWEARQDWLTIGHAQVRAYRLQARLLDHYQIVVLVSRVGEIMRVELPNGILLVNEALSSF